MLDLKFVLENLERVRERTRARRNDFDFDEVEVLAARRREAVHAFESLRAEQKRSSNEMKSLKPGSEAFLALRETLRGMSERAKELERERQEVEETLEARMLELPNLISDETPEGASEEDNVEVKRVGELPEFGFTPRDHVDLGESLGILDMPAAARISGARFAFLRGAGARLERALAAMMIDTHVREHGYEEMAAPYLVHAHALVGTGQLPKFEEDLFRTGDHYLIPTAEVPVTNYLRETLLDGFDAPLRFCTLTPCFRSEAGSHGRDVRGLIRMHQFQKVEMVKFCRPDQSEEEHRLMVQDACRILELLELPYRVIELCSADIGFAAARCYDIEVWLPTQDRYVEISSCSNCRDFQARRAQIRYRDEEGRPQFLHTLNGSGLAVGRAMVALLENHQQEDGSIRIPAALQPWFGAERIDAPA